MTPEFANHRLSSVQFLRGPDLQMFHHMVMEILRMKHDGENLPIPDEAEAGAWTKAYSLYERLKDRTALEEQRAVERNRWFEEDQKAWNSFIEDRESILDALRRDIFDEHTLREHLGVREDDLGDVLVKERNRDGENRRPDWVAVATRLASAIRWWHALSAEEKRTLRQLRVSRKLQAMQEARSHG